jgi:hypothetical protein
METDFFSHHYIDVVGATTRDMVSRLRRDGIITFDGITSPSMLRDLVARVVPIEPHRDSNASGVTVLRPREGPAAKTAGYLGFSREGLYPHTDGSAVQEPAMLVGLSCARRAPWGGDTLLVDGAAVFETLRTNAPGLLDVLQRLRSARFGSGDGLMGAVFSDADAGRVCVRFRRDDLVRYVPEAEVALPVLHDVIEALQVRVPLEGGQGYVVQNRRWLHGRTPFGGEREAWRVLGSAPRGSAHAEALGPGFPVTAIVQWTAAAAPGGRPLAGV